MPGLPHLTLTLLLSAGLVIGAGCSRRTAATSAVPASMAEAGAAWKNEPVVFLSDSSTWTARADEARGGNVLERRSVTWIRVNRRHPPAMQTLAFHDDETTELPSRVKVDVHYPDGTSWSAAEEDMPRTPSAILGVLASNGWRRVLRLPRYVEGMLIRREVAQTVIRPEFRTREFLRGQYPTVERHLAFRFPASWEIKAGFRNGERIPARVDGWNDSGWREMRVTAGMLPRLQPFHRLKYPEDWYAAFHFSVPARGGRSTGWPELGDRFLALLGGSLVSSPTVKALADSLPGRDPDSLALGAFALLTSRIRYLADESDLNAFIPRHPDTVLANGYGDCKEMANLMRALLAEKGVATGLALVHSPGRPQLHEEFPSLAPFDHMILYRRAGDGSVRYYDPTMASAEPGSSWLHLMGQKVLLLAPAGGSRLDTVEAAPGYRNRATTRSELRQGPGQGKGWELRGSVGLKGRAAFELNMALRYRHPSKDEARTAVWDFLAEGFGIQATEWDWRAPAGDSLEIGYAMPAEQMAVGLGKGGVKLDVPALMGMGGRGLDYEGDRHFPPFEQEDTWILPRGYRPLKAREFRQGAAMGRWTAGEGAARRSFRHDGMVWKAEEKPQLAEFLGRVSEFALAAVWR